MAAEIEVRNVINITGRGAVLIGYVRQGAPQIGQLTLPPASMEESFSTATTSRRRASA
jgi:hypothetical protein